MPLHTLTFSTAHMRTCNGPRSCGDDYLIAWIKNRIVSFCSCFCFFCFSFVFPSVFPFFCSFLSPLVSAGSSESCFLLFVFFWFLFFWCSCFYFLSVLYVLLCVYPCFILFLVPLVVFYCVSRCFMLFLSLFYIVFRQFNSLCMAQENNRCTW